MTVEIHPRHPSTPISLRAIGLIALGAALWSALALGGPSILRIVMIALLGLGIVVALVWRWPVQSLAWLPVLIVPPQVAKMFAYEVVLLLTAAGMLLYGWMRRESWVGKVDRLEIFVWLLFGWAAFTGLWVRDPWWYLFGVRKMLIGAIALWVAWRLVRFLDANLVLVGVAGCTCALALATLGKAYTMGWFESTHTEHMRRSATSLGWGDANFIAAILALMLPTSLHLAMAGRQGLGRIVGWISVPLTALVVTVAASRGGALLVLAIALFMIFRSRIRPWVALVTAPIVIALLLLGPGAKLLLERFTNVTDLASVVIRLMYFRVAWQRVLEYWPFGMGLGQGYGYLDRLYTEDPHNYWLVLGSELGLIGLALWLIVLVLTYRRIGNLVLNPATKTAGLALQLTFWIAQVNMLFEPTFQGLQYHFLWYWIMGAYFGWLDQESGRVAASSAPPDPAAIAAPART